VSFPPPGESVRVLRRVAAHITGMNAPNSPSRVPAGTGGRGGQFATQTHPEPDLDLLDDDDDEEPEPCAGVVARSTLDDPAEFCEEDAEPGSEYCRRHQGADERYEG